MIGRENEKFGTSENRICERFLARKMLSRILVGMFVVLGIVIIFLVIANYAQAGDYGVAIQHNNPSNGVGNVTPGVDKDYTVDVINTGSLNPGEDINFTVELDAASVAAGWTVTPTGTTIIPNVAMGVGGTVTETVTVLLSVPARVPKVRTV